MAINTDLILEAISSNSGESKKNIKRYKCGTNTNIVRDRSSTSSATSRFSNAKKSTGISSPYLCRKKANKSPTQNDRQIFNKRSTNTATSLLKMAIHKANSDEISKVQNNGRKKVKKSVLTLPNDAKLTATAQVTVSDMNESEYDNGEDRSQIRKYKKRIHKTTRKSQRNVDRIDYEYFDRDCNGVDIYQSSTDMVILNGNNKIVKEKPSKSKQARKDFAPQNIWAILKSINHFQFKPSPVISEDSFIGTKKNKQLKKIKSKRKQSPVIKKCQTKEFVQILSGEFVTTSPSYSKSSSFDRITVIDKRNDFLELGDSVEDRSFYDQELFKLQDKDQDKRRLSNFKNRKTISNRKQLYDDLSDNSNNLFKKRPDISNTKNNHKKNEKEKYSKDIKNSVGSNEQQDDLASYLKTYDSILFTNSTSSLTSYKHKTATKVPAYTRINHEQFVGGTKVENYPMLNKDNIVQEQRNRKLRLVTTMPSTAIKMTQAEIKRRLLLLKFPIIVLGKEQISSNIRVEEYEAPQFVGLDKRIWPFMSTWSNKYKSGTSGTTPDIRPRFKPNITINQPNNLKKMKHIVASPKEVYSNMYRENSDLQKEKSNIVKGERIKSENKVKNTNSKFYSPKSISEITDKMLKLLYKKSSIRSINANDTDLKSNKDEYVNYNDEKYPRNFDYSRKSFDANTTTNLSKRCQDKPETKRTKSNLNPSWSKSKWSSEFIENVIKKIKCGVYYNQNSLKSSVASTANNKNKCNIKSVKNTVPRKDEFVQTIKDKKKTTAAVEPLNLNSPNQFNDILNTLPIPGFEQNLPHVQIETLGQKQVVVKQCLANVLIEFEISGVKEVDSALDNLVQATCCIPIQYKTASNTVYKSKQLILNATLPEQLCTFLPTILKNLTQNKTISPEAIQSIQNNFELTTIPEVLINENQMATQLHSSSLYDRRYLKSNVTQSKKLVQEKRRINGSFKTENLRKKTKLSLNSDKYMKLTEYSKLLPYLKNKDFLYYASDPMIHLTLSTCVLPIGDLNTIAQVRSTPCTAVVPYNQWNNQSRTSNSSENLFTPFWKNLCTSLNTFGLSYFPNISSEITLKSPRNIVQSTSNLLFTLSVNRENFEHNKISTIEPIERAHCEKLLPKIQLRENANSKAVKPFVCRDQLQIHNKLPSLSKCKKKYRRQRYAKADRTYKPTTNVTGKHKSLTPLNKIRSIEDFFKVMGSEKSLASILDSQYAEKIFSSLNEMRTWVDKISSNQALLLLLLTNKKESPNLLRCRPLILQAIAANRITLASELDMEIEVIEREKLNKWLQVEGICYLPGSVENYDNLFEELCWIAKTTVDNELSTLPLTIFPQLATLFVNGVRGIPDFTNYCDYQRPYDENSKKLLRSLLAKRKSLNPSYLRVMARYVGLGLLKQPKTGSIE